MPLEIDHIFFDLDHTLWDYDANARLTLNDLFDHYNLTQFEISSSPHFFDCFLKINDALWSDYNLGKISKFYLRDERFRLVFESAGADMDLVTDKLLKDFNRDYLKLCPYKEKLIDGALEVLSYLEGKYRLNIITNGFEEIQTVKLKSAGIVHYFDKVITSEKAGFKKPFSGIFRYAMKHCQAIPERSIMIGDNLQTDIKGARDFGMAHAFFNPAKISHDHLVSHEIDHLRELKNIL